MSQLPPVFADELAVPNAFRNGEVADANEVNQNFETLAGGVNALDTRVGSLEADGVQIDTTPPVITGHAPLTIDFPDFVFEFTITDDTELAYYTPSLPSAINSANFTAQPLVILRPETISHDFSTELSLLHGSNEIAIMASDTAGNISTFIATYDYTGGDCNNIAPGANLSRCFIEGIPPDLDLSDAIFYQATISGATLIRTIFDGADLRQISIIGVTATDNTSFFSTDFTGGTIGDTSNFDSLDLSQANFTEADIAGVSYSDAALAGANFTGAFVRGANFFMAGLIGAIFTDATLGAAAGVASADFIAADLTGANFTGAVLNLVDFSSADLTDADFTGAFSSGFLVIGGQPIVTTNSTVFSNTTCPDGSNSDDNGNLCDLNGLGTKPF